MDEIIKKYIGNPPDHTHVMAKKWVSATKVLP